MPAGFEVVNDFKERWMPRRNYAELSPYDFECLVRDLLSADWGARLEAFAPGADGGTDVRLLRSKEKLVTIQCKHSPGKSWSDIKGAIVREANKVSGVDLGEYWLVTSAGLTPQAKYAAAALFEAQGLVPERVLAYPDLDALLDKHPAVERSNYKLYLTSTAVLELLVRPDLFLHAEDLRTGIEDRRKYYVQGPSLREAQEVLSIRNYTIISGPPGVGKTTLAEMLTLQLIEDGFVPYLISEDIREMDQLWKRDERQIFVYDDFLGQNSLHEKLGKNEDSRILVALERLQRSTSHKLIMTTREYILSAARQTYERLRDRGIDYSKIVIDLTRYSRFQKAHILYNHVYFSNLPSVARDALRQRGAYGPIIDHENYNPRLIRLVIDSAIAEGGVDAGANFPAYARNGLDHPNELWDHIYTQQLNDVARDVLITLLTFDRDASIDDFRLAVERYSRVVRGRFSVQEFQNALSVCDGVFVIVLMVADKRMIRFANPGIRDYLSQYLSGNVAIFGDLAASAVWPEQALSLCQMIEEPASQLGYMRRASRYVAEVSAYHREHPSSIVDACLAVVGKPSAAWHKHERPDGEQRMLRYVTDDEIIFARALKFASREDVERVLRLADDVLIPAWESGRGAKQSALVLLGEILGRTDGKNWFNRFFSAVESWFYNTTDDADDYAFVVTLNEDFSESSRRHWSELIGEFIQYAEAELENLLSEYNIDDVVHGLDTIESVARTFNVSESIADLLEQVSRHVSALEPEDDLDRSPHSSAMEDAADGDVGGLFNTLR